MCFSLVLKVDTFATSMSHSPKDSDSDTSNSSSEKSEYANKPVDAPTQQPLFGSSQGGGSSQAKGSRVWRLANAEMRIVGKGCKHIMSSFD